MNSDKAATAPEERAADERKIHITQLSTKLTEVRLRRHFEGWGGVVRVEVVESRQSRSSEDAYNFGWVAFEDRASVDAVLADKVSFFLIFFHLFVPV